MGQQVNIRILARINSWHDLPQQAFDHCLEDLLFIPELKKPVRESLNRIGKKDAASGKVVQLFEAKYSGQRKPETSDK